MIDDDFYDFLTANSTYLPDDVDWFKPVRLNTKSGCTGHIRESLGTHGRMKCSFSSMLKQQDTIMLPLYKRVFPKFDNTQSTDNRAVF